MATITFDNGSLILDCKYDPGLVADLKARIPYTERRFEKRYNGQRNVWIVAPKHGQTLQKLVLDYLRESVSLPLETNVKPKKETRILEVRYLGKTKDRGNGERSAFGHCNGSWSVVFPEQVLRYFFLAGDARPGESSTLYAALGITQNASDDEIKVAYRRMAKQWHPDVCKEPDAADQFRNIQEAYEVLLTKRAKYDAGLALARSLGQPTQVGDTAHGYRAPLRCGFVLAEGIEQIGRFEVSRILDWKDIVNPQGLTLVVSWAAGADHYTENWI